MRGRGRAVIGAALAALLLLVGACGGDDGQPETATDAPTPESAATPDEEPTADGDATADEASPAADEAATEDEAAADDEGAATLTIYSGRDPELIEQIIDLFEEETGVQVFTRYGNSAEMSAQLLEEGDRTPAEVFYSQEVGAIGVLARAGLLAPLPDATIERVAPRFRPGEEHLWVGVTGRSRVIAYNPDVLAEAGVDVPAGVLDLTDPAYEGLVAWVPDNAGFQAFVTGFRVSRGEDAARAWLEAMIANGAQRIAGNSGTLEAIEAGDQALGLINHYYWGRATEELGGLDEQTARLVFPAGDDPGGLVNATAVGITATGADNPAARQFVDFLLSDEVQALFASELFEYPVVPGVPGPETQSELIPALDELEGPDLDLTDLDDLEGTQALLRELGLID